MAYNLAKICKTGQNPASFLFFQVQTIIVINYMFNISRRENTCLLVLMNPTALTLTIHRNAPCLAVNISSALIPVSPALSLPSLQSCKVPSFRVAALLLCPALLRKAQHTRFKGSPSSELRPKL